MRLFLILSTLVLTAGCGSRAMTDQDRTWSFTVPHQMSQHDAYSASEVWIAEAFVSAKAVIDVRQPENGLIIGKSFVTTLSAEPYFPRHQADYSYAAKITSADKSTRIVFTFDANSFLSHPIGDDGLDTLHADTYSLAERLAVALHGAVAEPKPVPLVTESPSSGGAKDTGRER